MASSAADQPVPMGDGGAPGDDSRNLYDLRHPPFAGDDQIGQLNLWAGRVIEKFKTSDREIVLLKGGVDLGATIAQEELKKTSLQHQADMQSMADAAGTTLRNLSANLDQEFNKTKFIVERDFAKLTSEAKEKFTEQERSLSMLASNAKEKFDDLDQKCEFLNMQTQTADANLRSQIDQYFAAKEASSTASTGVPEPVFDPWQDKSLGSVGSSPSLATIGNPPGMGYEKGTGKGFNCDAKNWGQNKLLSLTTFPEQYLTWRDRALGHLAKDRYDIEKMLIWSETQKKAIDDTMVQQGIKDAGVPVIDHAEINRKLFNSIMSICSDELLGRIRLCNNNGLELWRKLRSEWEGTSAHVIEAKAKRFQEPLRTSTLLKLWETLPAWKQMGLEVEAGEWPIVEWTRSLALMKLIPESLEKEIQHKPELNSYILKLSFIELQMDHARSIDQARLHNRPKGGDKSGDDQMGLGGLGGDETAQSDADWYRRGYDALNFFYQKGQKGKGKGGDKGGGKGYGGKGYGKPGGGKPFGGKPAGGKPAGGKGEKGACWTCGKQGHRQFECPSGSPGKPLNEVAVQEETAPTEEAPAIVPQVWCDDGQLWDENFYWPMGNLEVLDDDPVPIHNRFNLLDENEWPPVPARSPTRTSRSIGSIGSRGNRIGSSGLQRANSIGSDDHQNSTCSSSHENLKRRRNTTCSTSHGNFEEASFMPSGMTAYQHSKGQSPTPSTWSITSGKTTTPTHYENPLVLRDGFYGELKTIGCSPGCSLGLTPSDLLEPEQWSATPQTQTGFSSRLRTGGTGEGLSQTVRPMTDAVTEHGRAQKLEARSGQRKTPESMKDLAEKYRTGSLASGVSTARPSSSTCSHDGSVQGIGSDQDLQNNIGSTNASADKQRVDTSSRTSSFSHGLASVLVKGDSLARVGSSQRETCDHGMLLLDGPSENCFDCKHGRPYRDKKNPDFRPNDDPDLAYIGGQWEFINNIRQTGYGNSPLPAGGDNGGEALADFLIIFGPSADNHF